MVRQGIIRNIWPIRSKLGGSTKLYKFLKRELNIQKGERVLEVGIGIFKGFIGYSTDVGETGLFIGIDKDEKTIIRLLKWKIKKNRPEEFKLADATKLPFEKNYFDKVVMNNFTGDYEKAIEECANVLKDEGKFVLGFVRNPLEVLSKRRAGALRTYLNFLDSALLEYFTFDTGEWRSVLLKPTANYYAYRICTKKKLPA